MMQHLQDKSTLEEFIMKLLALKITHQTYSTSTCTFNTSQAHFVKNYVLYMASRLSTPLPVNVCLYRAHETHSLLYT